ncbi:hypothetical protein EDB92DRAFT_1900312 [Lactarius akahatsu]|uniref:Uncharacterized protein n=1 Tax=Lactarius akahatsu TaxID=416441 RepID=A0AAD4LBT9_9AGAM|nr:hypothetical protein EDB92DRAFT_1900312 [Lactarius akahatsu]
MLRNRTNLEDLTETNRTTIAPAPAPHPLATDGAYRNETLFDPLVSTQWILQHPFAITSCTHSSKCRQTPFPIHRRGAMAAGVRYFPHLHAMQQHHTSIPLLVYLWRLNGQLQTKHSGSHADASIELQEGPKWPSRIASFRKVLPILVCHPVICFMCQMIRFLLSLILLPFILTGVTAVRARASHCEDKNGVLNV